MTSDGIEDTDWTKVAEVAAEIANLTAKTDSQPLEAETRLFSLLDGLEQKYGLKPSILATRADYLEDISFRQFLYRAAYKLAIETEDYLNCTLISSSLAQLLIEEAKDLEEGKIWLDELVESLAKRWDDSEHQEYLRLSAVIAGKREP